MSGAFGAQITPGRAQRAEHGGRGWLHLRRRQNADPLRAGGMSMHKNGVTHISTIETHR
jgi:hypothetical protein